MSFIGIVAYENIENCIDKKLEKELNVNREKIFDIKEKNIENIKNISFETIIIAREFNNKEILKRIIEKANYLIVNSDIKENLDMLLNMKATIITYGFNSKATITASSVQDEEMIICVQRTMQTIKGKIIEPQEFIVPIYENVECTMSIITTLLLYGKII